MRVIKNTFLILCLFSPLFVYSQTVTNLNLFLKQKTLPFGLTKLVPVDRPEVSLVLSGGGSRALAHIGVLKAIEELEIPIDQIVGTSMGSVIGGLYSSGYTVQQIDSTVKAANWEEIFALTKADRINLFIDKKITEDKALLTLRLNGLKPIIPKSINAGKKISNYLTSLTINAPINNSVSFDNLLYKYRAVCTELVTGNRIVLKDGLLSEAMRASSSVSFLLPPVLRDSLILVDGGLVDNLPIKTALELKPDYIIASDATSSLRTRDELEFPWEVADQLVTIPSRIIWEESINKADVFIRHNLNKRKNDDFENVEEIIKAGYDASKYLLLTTKNKLEDSFKTNLTNDEKYYNNITLPLISNELEKDIHHKFSEKDSVSKSEILYELYSYYQKGGYKDLSAQIVDSVNTIIKINYKLNPKVSSIQFNGLTLLPLETAQAQFEVIRDKPYSSDKILNATLQLLSKYRQKGYVLATIDNIFFNEENGVLNLVINEGMVKEIEIVGNVNTLPSVVTREFVTGTGEFLLKENLDEGLENITATDLFDHVIVSFQEREVGKKIKIELEEKISNILRLGLRIDNENFTQLALDIRNENLFGTGSELGFSLSGGVRNRSYILEHKTNRIFNTYLTYKAQAFYNFNDVNVYQDDIVDNQRKFSRSKMGEYRQIFYGGFVGVGAHLKKLGTLTAEGKYQIDEIKNISSISENQTYKEPISTIRFRLQIDSQNKYPFPTKGVYVDTYYETAQKFLGSTISFAKLSFDYSNYFSIENHTLRPRVIFGFGDETLPLSRQFDFGGQKNFFGYREFEFRGRQIMIASMEYRYKLPFDIYVDTYLKLRYDLGSSWTNQEEIHFKHLKHGLGLSISFDTPVGPAEFSVGRSLLLKDTSPERIVSRGPFFFYFTIGYYY